MSNKIDKALDRWTHAVALLETSQSIVKHLENALENARATQTSAEELLEISNNGISKAVDDEWGL